MAQEFTLLPSPQSRDAKAIWGDVIEESWTPVVAATVQGDLSVSYSKQIGRYHKHFNEIRLAFAIRCVPTYTTASGNLRITGLPFICGAPTSAGAIYFLGNLAFETLTLANYTQFVPVVSGGSNIMGILCSGQGQLIQALPITAVASTDTLQLYGSLHYTTSF